MEPTVMGSGLAARQASSDVAEFLTELQHAQTVVLELLASAAGRFPSSHGQLAPMCGIAARLTRQLFDAQRCILSREAEIDALVEQVAATTATDADEIRRTVMAAVRDGSAGSVDIGSVVRDVCADSAPVTSATVRGAIAELSTEVLRTIEDVEAVRSVLDAAFVPDEPEWRPTADALAAVLDDWWSRRGTEQEVAIADASARRRLALHLTRLECQEIVRSAGAGMVRPDHDSSVVPADDGDSEVAAEWDLESLEPQWAGESSDVPGEVVVARLDGDPLPDIRNRDHEPVRSRAFQRSAWLGLAWTR